MTKIAICIKEIATRALQYFSEFAQPLRDKNLKTTINVFFSFHSIYWNNFYAVVKFFDSVITSISRFNKKLAQYVNLYRVVINSGKGSVWHLAIYNKLITLLFSYDFALC